MNNKISGVLECRLHKGYDYIICDETIFLDTKPFGRFGGIYHEVIHGKTDSGFIDTYRGTVLSAFGVKSPYCFDFVERVKGKNKQILYCLDDEVSADATASSYIEDGFDVQKYY